MTGQWLIDAGLAITSIEYSKLKIQKEKNVCSSYFYFSKCKNRQSCVFSENRTQHIHVSGPPFYLQPKQEPEVMRAILSISYMNLIALFSTSLDSQQYSTGLRPYYPHRSALQNVPQVQEN